MKKFNGLCVTLIVLLLLYSGGVSAKAAENLLTNGSFEAPDVSAAPGYQSGFAVAPTNWLKWCGGFFYLVNETSGFGTAADGHQWIQTSFDEDSYQSTNLTHLLVLPPGQYTVTFNYTGNAGQAGAEGVLIRTFDWINGTPANMGDHVYTYTGDNSAANPDWQSAQFIMGVNKNATQTAISILGQSYGAPEGTAMWIDNMTITEGVIEIPACSPNFPVGDLNKDCMVNFVDFAILAAHWLEDTTPVPLNYDAPHAVTPPVINGILSAGEWSNGIDLAYPDTPESMTLLAGAAPTDNSDCSTTTYFKWDTNNLYIAVNVNDPDHAWAIAKPGPYNNGTQDVVQIGFNFGDYREGEYLVDSVVWDVVADTLDNAGPDIYQHDPPFDKTGVSVASSISSTGYIVEVAMPWSKIHASYVPQVGNVHGFTRLHVDVDEGVLTLLSDIGNGNNVVTDLSKWNTLTLGN